MRMAETLQRSAGIRLQATEIDRNHQEIEFHLIEK